MNTTMRTGGKMKLLAGVTALAATLFTAGGTLALADRYARTAADGKITTMAGDAAADHAAATATVAFAG